MTPLSTRAYNALRNELYYGHPWPAPLEIEPQDVTKFSARELMWLPNVGVVTVDEIRDWLAQFGMCLRDEDTFAMWDR